MYDALFLMLNTIKLSIGEHQMNSISSSLPPPPPGATMQKQSLSDDQRSTISESLSAYDPENLTAEEAKSIVETFSNAGIRPGQELANAMAEAGFDAHAVGELAGNERPSGPPPGPPPPQAQNQGLSEDMLSTLESLLEEYEGEGLDEDIIVSISKTMQEIFGLEPSGSLIDTSA